MYSKHFCIDCKNNWDCVPAVGEGQPCPSCGSTNTRYLEADDPTDKSEVRFVGDEDEDNL